MPHDPITDLRAKAEVARTLIPLPPAQPVQAAPPPLVLEPAVSPALSRIQELQQIANSEEGNYALYHEIHRITNLPLSMPLDDATFEDVNRRHLLAEAYASGFRLFRVQAQAIYEYEQFGGLFGPIGVGWGKTLICFVVAGINYRNGLKKGMYFVPPNVYSQAAEVDLRWARTKVPIPYPVYKLGGKNRRARRNIAKADRPGLYILPYSLLSTPDTEELLNVIRPQFMVLDECHEVRHPHSARTKRLFGQTGYVKRHSPKMADLSGTITAKSVRDYWHLITTALGQNCPLPLSGSLASEWSSVLDSEADEEGSATGPLEPLIRWARLMFPDEKIAENRTGFRRAYQLRLASTPGVVSSGDADIGISLSLQNNPVPNFKDSTNWQYLEHLISQVSDAWLTPNMDPIEHAIHTWKWLHELTAGFYNQLTWPTAEKYAERKNISQSEAEDILDRAQEHHEAANTYAGLLRQWLENHHIPGLDTPFLIGQHFYQKGRGAVDESVYEAWCAKQALDFEGRPDRDSTAIRVCDYKVNDACTWAQNLPKGEGGIIWVHHRAMGEWVYEWLCHYGVNAMHCPAGDRANEQIRDPENADKVVVASIKAHGQGKNLQHFRHQYVLQWPRQATVAEQMLGRTHRNGQQADSLIVRTNNTLSWDNMNFAACINDALYIHQTTGNRQKLIYAGYDPLPVIFSNAFLLERGLEVATLTPQQQQLLTDKFQPQGAAV